MCDRGTRFTSIVLACLVSAACRGQPGAELLLAPTIELPHLVDLAAERLAVNIEYDSRLSGSVRLRLGAGVSDRELWSLTNRLLAARDLATVRMGTDPTLSVVPLSAAADTARLESLEQFKAPTSTPPPGFRTVLVPLTHREPGQVVDMIEPFLSSKHGRARALAESNAVILSDLSDRLEDALDRLATFDRDSEVVTEEITLGALSAVQLIETIDAVHEAIESLGGRRPTGRLLPGSGDRSVRLLAPLAEHATWRDMIDAIDRDAGTPTETYGSRNHGPAELEATIRTTLEAAGAHAQIETDESSGTVTVSASPFAHSLIRQILDRKDNPSGALQLPSRTFRLLNRDAAEVLTVANQLVNAGMLGIGASPDRTASIIPPPGTIAGEIEAGVERSFKPRMAIDPATNSIIAIAPHAELERLGSLIREIDVRRPQVLIEVLIVSLSESDSMDLGIEIERLIDGPNDTLAKLSSLFGLSQTSASDGSINGNRGAGLTGIVLSPGDFVVALRALQSVNRGRSLSMPKVLVASNEQASINSVLEQPYTTVNASDTVATTAYGGSSPAGTEVSVTPQIAQGDHLRLEYTVSLSAFVGEAAEASVPPPKQQNNVSSVATIPDGYTIAVGGIELLSEGEAETGIPLLSDIPVLGEAFKNRSRSSSRARFFVFIRPTILRDHTFEDLKHLSDIDTLDAAVEDGWPTPSPGVIR